MSDPIDRQAAIDTFADYIHDVNKLVGTRKLSVYECKDIASRVLKKMPSIESETGQWIKEDHGHVEYTGVCNKCGFDWGWYDTQKYFNFCPNCGKKMNITI